MDVEPWRLNVGWVSCVNCCARQNLNFVEQLATQVHLSANSNESKKVFRTYLSKQLALVDWRLCVTILSQMAGAAAALQVDSRGRLSLFRFYHGLLPVLLTKVVHSQPHRYTYWLVKSIWQREECHMHIRLKRTLQLIRNTRVTLSWVVESTPDLVVLETKICFFPAHGR